MRFRSRRILRRIAGGAKKRGRDDSEFEDSEHEEIDSPSIVLLRALETQNEYFLENKRLIEEHWNSTNRGDNDLYHKINQDRKAGKLTVREQILLEAYLSFEPGERSTQVFLVVLRNVRDAPAELNTTEYYLRQDKLFHNPDELSPETTYDEFLHNIDQFWSSPDYQSYNSLNRGLYMEGNALTSKQIAELKVYINYGPYSRKGIEYQQALEHAKNSAAQPVRYTPFQRNRRGKMPALDRLFDETL